MATPRVGMSMRLRLSLTMVLLGVAASIVSQTVGQSIAVSVGIAAAAALTALLLAHSLTAPLLRLTAASQRMAKGDLGAPLAIDGPREVAVLAASLNAMRRSIREQFQVLQQEIDVRRTAEAQLRKGQSRFRSVVESNMIGIMFADGVTGQVHDANDAFLQITGRSRRELESGLINLRSITPSEFLPADEVARHRAQRTGYTSPYEKQFLHRDGMRVPVLVGGAPLDGEPDQMVSFVLDLSERRLAEATLRESEERYRNLVEMSPDMIFIHCDGRFVFINGAGVRLLGGDGPEQFYGRSAMDFVHTDSLATAEARLVHLHGGQTVTWSEEKIVRLDGTTVDAEVVALPFTYQGRPAVQGIARDITERKRAELALRQAAQRTERLLEQVISVQEEERKRIARELHDGVSQSLMSLLVGLLTFEDVGELQTAREQARTLRAAAKQTLDDVRRLSSGLRPSVLDDLGLLPALERYVTDYASTHGVRAEIDAEQFRPPGRLPAPVETAVYRIVQEAMGNTAKHAGAKSVRVCLDCQGPELEVLIEDDGVGFDSAKTLETIDVNQHMGLRSMEERAVLVGGSLEIDSVPNEGTTILVRIPIRLQAGAVPAANVTTAEEAPGTGQA